MSRRTLSPEPPRSRPGGAAPHPPPTPQGYWYEGTAQHRTVTVYEADKPEPRPLLYRADGTPLTAPPPPPAGFAVGRKE